MGNRGLTSLFTENFNSLPLTTTRPQATKTLTGLSWAMKTHTSEVTSCRCTSSSAGMEQSQFFKHLCSKYQVNYLAAAIQVEPKLLALLRSRWVLKPQAHSALLYTERLCCLSLQRPAQHDTSSGSTGDLAFLLWPLFFHTGVKWSVGRKKSLVLSKKINIYAHKARQHCAANTDCGSNLQSHYRCMDLNLV